MSKKGTSLDDIAEAIRGLATQMDERFEQVDARFAQVDEQLGGMRAQLSTLETEAYINRKEHREMREWAQKVSQATGIPLPKF